MKAYIDLMLINSIMVNLGAFHMIKVILNKPAERGRIIGLSFILSLRVFLIYFNPLLSYIVGVAFEIVFFIIFYKRTFYKRLLLYYLYLIIINFLTVLTFRDYAALKGQILVITHSKGIFLLLCNVIFYFAIDLIRVAVDKLFHLGSYKMKVLMSSGHNKKILNAYFDSGNTLKYLNNPVIFIKEGVFKFDEADEVKFEVTDKKLFRYPLEKIYKVLITCGIRKESYFAYAAVVTTEADFYDCDMLLNVYIRG